jgi:hypothetical protein
MCLRASSARPPYAHARHERLGGLAHSIIEVERERSGGDPRPLSRLRAGPRTAQAPGGQSEVLVGGIHGRSAPQRSSRLRDLRPRRRRARGLVRLDYFRIAYREWTAMEQRAAPGVRDRSRGSVRAVVLVDPPADRIAHPGRPFVVRKLASVGENAADHVQIFGWPASALRAAVGAASARHRPRRGQNTTRYSCTTVELSVPFGHTKSLGVTVVAALVVRG